MKKLILTLLLSSPALAQIPAPQIPLTGNIGCSGFPCLNNGTLVLSLDADHTMTAQETSAFYIKVTSSVPLTSPRTLHYPAGNFPVGVENATTGGQAINVCPVSGSCVTVPNSTTTFTQVWYDGTNFVSLGSSSGGAVASVFGRTGVVTAQTGDYGVGQVTGAAPLASPSLTGIPTAPTAAPGTNTNQLATTAYVLANGGGTGCTAGGSAGNILITNGSGGCTGDANFTYSPTSAQVSLFGQNSLVLSPIYSTPGWNYGSPGQGVSTGALVVQNLGFTTTFLGQGNHTLFGGNVYGNANGDLNGIVLNGEYSAANTDGSAQGLTVFADQIGIDSAAVYTANVSSTGTPSGFPGVTLAVSGFNGGTFAVGRWLIDKTTAATFTATGATTQGSGTGFYSAVTETGQTFTPSKQGSIAASFNGHTVPNPNNLPVLATFTVTIGSSCSVGDQFTIGGVNVESAKIVSVTGYSGGVMTATAWFRSSHATGDPFFCEGPTGQLVEQNADRNGGARWLFVVLGAINSTTLAIAREVPNGTDSGFINGTGTDTIYQGARVVNALDPSTGAVNGNLTLAETSATFTAGDSLEVPNGTTVNHTAGRWAENAINLNPYTQGPIYSTGCTSGSTECGNLLNGQSIYNFTNQNPTSNYTINGGRWFLKRYTTINGPIGDFAYFQQTPVAPIFEFQTMNGGSTNIWQVDDIQFFMQIGETGGVTTQLTRANNFTFSGPSATADAFSNLGSFNLAGTISPLLLNGSAGSSGQCPISGGAGVTPTWGPCGSGSPGGSTGNLQYNNLGVFGGDANTADDGAGNLTAKTYTATGPQGIVFTAGASLAAPAAGKAVFTTDASVGNGMLSENNGAASRICTAANGVCSAGGGITNNTTTTGTTAVSANTCTTASTVTLTGLATSNTINFTPTSDTSSVAGWGSPSSGLLYIVAWPSAANTASYKVCNATSSSITPGASVTWNVSGK